MSKKTPKIPRPNIALVNPASGLVSRAWNEYFTAVQDATTYSAEDVLMISIMLHAGLKALAFARVGAFQS